MRDKPTYDDIQANAVTLTCTRGCGSWHCMQRKLTCPVCHKPSLRKLKPAPRPIEGRQS